MIDFPCSKLADYLDSIEDLKNIVTGGVWFGKIVKDKNDELILTLRVVSDEPNTEYEKIARIQMILYIPRSITASVYLSVFNTVNRHVISKENGERLRNMDGFHIRNAEGGSTFGPDYDHQDNIIMSKDYLFYYSSRQGLNHQIS